MVGDNLNTCSFEAKLRDLIDLRMRDVWAGDETADRGMEDTKYGNAGATNSSLYGAPFNERTAKGNYGRCTSCWIELDWLITLVRSYIKTMKLPEAFQQYLAKSEAP